MPEADVPEGKITRELTMSGMPWLVLAIDECQLAFEELGSDTAAEAGRDRRRETIGSSFHGVVGRRPQGTSAQMRSWR